MQSHLILPAGVYLGETSRRHAVTGFGFSEAVYAPSARLPSHSHAHACFCFVLGGSYAETYGRRTRDCVPGTLVFHPAEEVHSDRHFDAPVRLFCVEVEPARLEAIRTNSPVLDHPLSFNGGSPAWLGTRLYREFQNWDAFSPLAIEGLTLEMFAELSRRSAAVPEGLPRWLAQVEQYLRDGYTDGLSLSEAAQVAGVHPVHLARVFRRRFGCTPAEFVRRLRIEAACRRLSASSEPIGEIALAAGFADQSHFSRVFKRLIGMTPAEYRRGFISS